MRSTPRPRAIVASVAAAVSGFVFASQVGTKEGAWIPTVAILTGAVCSLVPRLFPQLLARGLLWSNLLLGTLICVLGGRSDFHYSLPLLLGCGFALLLGERRALAEASDLRGARPAAFAGTIELLMILALADAQTFAFFAVIDGHADATRAAYAGAAIALLVGFVGLYCLAKWGFVVTMGTAGLFAAGVVAKAIRVDNELVVPLVLLMALQLLVPLPMLASMITGCALPSPNRRARAITGAILISSLVLVSIAAAWRRP